MISTRVLPRTNFNPRSPDGERRSDHCRCHYRPEISIHAPRMGSDLSNDCKNSFTPLFQSTLPGWGATLTRIFRHSTSTYFNPRSPDGERRVAIPCWMYYGTEFQSTLPGWGATRDTPKSGRLPYNFNPRSPDGERLYVLPRPLPCEHISIHAPRMGSDHLYCEVMMMTADFNPRSPDGERPAQPAAPRTRPAHFNPRSPDGERLGLPRWLTGLYHFNPRSPDGERPRKWTSSPTIWAKSSIFNTDCIADRH